MATYSRSQTTTQTAQTTAMPSMDISSLLVKTMENVMNDKQDDDKSFEDSISKGINNSDLLKDKTKNDTNKELADLLKDKKNSDKELSNLLKDTNKNSKESKKDSSAGKIVSTSVIAATVGSVLKSKSLGGVVSGTGKLAGGLVSGVGNIGGSLIAGVGKLFGPVGGIVGKAVGAAVAAPFKLVGGTITAAIGGLGKLLSMPLKEILTKGTLIVGVLSQLFVFLEGLMAKFIAEKDIKWIDFMSKLKSNIAMIPDRIKLSLEKILSQVTIMGQPIFGRGLSKDEKKELKALEKKDTALSSAQDKLMQQAGQWLGKGVASEYDISDPEQREALKQAMLAKTAEQTAQGIMPAISERDIEGYFSTYEKRAAKSKLSEEDIQRMAELRAKKEGGGRDFAKEEEALAEKEQALREDYFAKDLYKYSQKKGGLTEYQQEFAESLHSGSVASVRGMYAESGGQLTTRDATGAERFLKNQYKEWTDAWGKMFKDLKQDIGINITQKQDIPNPSYHNQ